MSIVKEDVYVINGALFYKGMISALKKRGIKDYFKYVADLIHLRIKLDKTYAIASDTMARDTYGPVIDFHTGLYTFCDGKLYSIRPEWCTVVGTKYAFKD